MAKGQVGTAKLEGRTLLDIFFSPPLLDSDYSLCYISVLTR